MLNAKSIRSFSVGILLSASVCGAAYFFEPKQENAKISTVKPTEIEAKALLTNKGYVIQTKDEWQKQQAAIEAASMKNQEKSSGTDQSTETEKIVYRTMLSVTSGMTSIDVGNALVHAHIIDDAFAFSKDVEAKGLAQELRPGTFEVESNMTVDEIIATIFQ